MSGFRIAILLHNSATLFECGRLLADCKRGSLAVSAFNGIVSTCRLLDATVNCCFPATVVEAQFSEEAECTRCRRCCYRPNFSHVTGAFRREMFIRSVSVNPIGCVVIAEFPMRTIVISISKMNLCRYHSLRAVRLVVAFIGA